MRRRSTWTMLSVLVAGCASAASTAVDAPPTSPGTVESSIAPEPTPPAPASTAPEPLTTADDTTDETADDTTDEIVVETTDPTVPTQVDASDATLVETAEPALSLEDRIRAEDFEPVFEIGPSVELDVDVARFPVDDAGLGGGPPGASDEPGSSVDAPTGWAAFNSYLEDVLIRPENTAAAVAVMIGGDLVNAAAFGVRDPARGEPVAPTDRFRIASISKPITAIVALDLVEEGAIGLDDPVGDLIAEHVGATAVSSGASQLTLRRLLTHTSGFGKFYGTFFQLGAVDCPDAARQGLATASGGGGYTYSNMNYCLAGMVIEAVTGESLERATYRHLLTPLGISGMRLAPTVDPGPGEAQHRTTPGRAYMETLGGAGSWIASPIDLVTIMDSLDTTTSGFKPLEPLSVVQMLTPSGGQLGQRGYGLGVISYGDGRVGHTGTIEATHAMVLDRGDGVVWAVTVAGDWPLESERLERLVDEGFASAGFVAG